MLLTLFDYMGVMLFAVTGALAASRKQLDLIGFIFLATITGIGGGTFRDLILDVPVFWVLNPTHVLLCTLAACLAFFTAHLMESRYHWLLWLDAIALAAYGVFGAYKGFSLTGSPVIAIMMGALTGSLGGILRDVLANEPSVLLRKEIYITAPVCGAAIYVLAQTLGATVWFALIAGFMVAFIIRSGALLFGWVLPTYRSRPGRHFDDKP